MPLRHSKECQGTDVGNYLNSLNLRDKNDFFESIQNLFESSQNDPIEPSSTTLKSGKLHLWWKAENIKSDGAIIFVNGQVGIYSSDHHDD